MTADYPFIPFPSSNKSRVDYTEYIEVGFDVYEIQPILDGLICERAKRKEERRLFEFDYMRPLDSFKFICRCNVYCPVN